MKSGFLSMVLICGLVGVSFGNDSDSVKKIQTKPAKISTDGPGQSKHAAFNPSAKRDSTNHSMIQNGKNDSINGSQRKEVKINQYGENDLQVQTRIADATDDTKFWSNRFGIASIVIALIALVIGFIQWHTSRKQSRQELRAYLSISVSCESVSGINRLLQLNTTDALRHERFHAESGPNPFPNPPTDAVYKILVKNYGATPAYNFGIRYVSPIKIREYPPPKFENEIFGNKEFVKLEMKKLGFGNGIMLVHGESAIKEKGIENEIDIESLRGGQKAISVYVVVDYSDIFGRQYELTFVGIQRIKTGEIEGVTVHDCNEREYAA